MPVAAIDARCSSARRSAPSAPTWAPATSTSRRASRATLVRTRRERGAHGEAIEGAFISRLDELRDADLRPSVDETFERAAARMWKESERAMAKKREPLHVPPRWWKPVRCARLLLSGADLIEEGRDMHHCAAGYAGYVAKGDSVIVALSVPFCRISRRTYGDRRLLPRDKPVSIHRSTVELDRRTLRVLQHRGPSNSEPHGVCRDALAVLLRRWGDSVTSCPVDWGCVDQFKDDEDLPF